MLCGSVDAMYDFFGCFRESVVLLWWEGVLHSYLISSNELKI